MRIEKYSLSQNPEKSFAYNRSKERIKKTTDYSVVCKVV